MKYILGISIPLFILDQLTKWAILKKFPEEPYGIDVIIPNFFNLVRVHNNGMAFGLGNGSANANWIFGGIALTAVIGIAVFWRKNAFPDRLSKTAVALLVAGIFGNLTDRILHGYVVDFLDFKLPLYHLIDKSGHFPSFNVADSCICIAAGLLIIGAIRGMREEAAQKKLENDKASP
jgi:signal peptidase II